MKFRLNFVFFFFLLSSAIFSGCSREIIEIKFEDDEKNLSSKNEIDSNSKTDTDKLVENSEQQTIGNLLNQNKNLKCIWRVEKPEVKEDAEIDNEDEELSGGVEEGTIYLAGKKFKQEIKIKESSRENLINILRDDAKVYQWSSILPQGTRMTFKKAEELEVINLNKKYNWHCEEWEFDEKIFQIPDGINFIEIKEDEVFM